ncbi:sugar ABC transporter substrate-binding protein [Microbacterium deminutum]|uniref:Sugar ABC transporter substrate-binding protein n=1 Tax=Microbacterium deminutum TaxID=344164 RepID=A0ABN2R6I7_9MICO
MNKKGLVAAAVIVVGLSTALAGCAGGSGGVSSTAAGGQKLLVEDYYAGPQAANYDKIYQSCAAKAGNTVTANHVPNGGLIPKVLQQISSKTLPDVLMLDNPDVQQIADSGALTPLKDYGLSSDGMTQGVVDAGTYKGELYGLAPGVNSLGLFYNKDMLTAAGIQPPTTWDELRAAAKKLTASGRYGFAFSGVNNYEGTWQFMPWMWSNGGDEKDLKSPENAQALQFLADLIKDGSVSQSVVNWSQGDVNNQFIAGKAAMMENGPWQIPALKQAKINFGYVPIPPQAEGKKSQTPLGGETFTVPNTGDNAKMAAAGKFVGCLNTAENEALIADQNNYVPSNVEAAKKFGESNADLSGFVQIVADARSRTAELGVTWPDIATQIYTAEQLVLTGKATPQDALAQATAGK